MANGKKGSNFWLLGAAYWLVIAALMGIVHFFWPGLSDSEPFILAVVFGTVIAGFVIVYLFRPK